MNRFLSFPVFFFVLFFLFFSLNSNYAQARELQISGEVIREIERQGEILSQKVNLEDGLDEKEAAEIRKSVFKIFKMLYGENFSLWSATEQRLNSLLNRLKAGTDGFKEKVSSNFETIKELITKNSELKDEDDTYDEDDPFADSGFGAVGPGEFAFEKWPDENGVDLVKMVDAYGVERYSSDGKHFYDNPYSAANSKKGIRAIVNKIKDGYEGVKNWIFGVRYKDPEKRLKDKIARELLEDIKRTDEKELERIYEKYADKLKGGVKFANIPAKLVVELSRELPAADFSSAVQLYIEERESGKSPKYIRENLSEIFSGGYGTFGNSGAISLITKNKYAESVLYARLEEAYQRYQIAKKFGRTE